MLLRLPSVEEHPSARLDQSAGEQLRVGGLSASELARQHGVSRAVEETREHRSWKHLP